MYRNNCTKTDWNSYHAWDRPRIILSTTFVQERMFHNITFSVPFLYCFRLWVLIRIDCAIEHLTNTKNITNSYLFLQNQYCRQKFLNIFIIFVEGEFTHYNKFSIQHIATFLGSILTNISFSHFLYMLMQRTPSVQNPGLHAWSSFFCLHHVSPTGGPRPHL